MASIDVIDKRRAATFARLEACALAGERCPTRDRLPTDDVTWLAHSGKIRIEVSTHNWRVVTILVGPNKGKATAPNPIPSRVYLRIDAAGTFRNGKRIDNLASRSGGARQEPSKPRLLPYAGKP